MNENISVLCVSIFCHVQAVADLAVEGHESITSAQCSAVPSYPDFMIDLHSVCKYFSPAQAVADVAVVGRESITVAQ